MMGRIGNWRGQALSCLAAYALASSVTACSSPSSEEDSSLFEPLLPPGTVRGDVPPDPPAMPAAPVATPPGMEGTPPVAVPPVAVPPMENGMQAEIERQPGACRAPLGVSAAPETISQALILLNTLPKPTTMECFLQALERPMNVYFTANSTSLQPAVGARSPRTFLQRGNLYMSIVFGGDAMDTLEFGYRLVPDRSIKAEIEFPITRDLSEDTLFDRIATSDTTTVCGACHVREGREELPAFPKGAFVSEIFEPYDTMEVDLETMRVEATSCDESAESARCGMLAALFDNGPLVQGTLPGKQ